MDSRLDALKQHLEQHILGQETLVERLIVGILAGGHLLLEGLPGLAKTTAARSLASGMDMQFQRIQFTPDLIPGDITGSEIYLPQQHQFEFLPGPVFTDILLADEINRAPPKVQSALLEVMEEKQVTAGGKSYPLSPAFTVIATQNPIEHEGTYPLPEAQLDRFMMKITINTPGSEQQLAILEQGLNQSANQTHTPNNINAEKLNIEQLQDLKTLRASIYIDDMIKRYIVTLATATHNPGKWDDALEGHTRFGASPRASLALAQGAQALAMLRGRDFVEPSDIMALAGDVFSHRIGLSFTALNRNISSQNQSGQKQPERALIQQLIERIPAP